jgi:hypothetical protein
MIWNLRRPRLTLRAALRSYWPWLAVQLFASAVIFTFPGFREHPSSMGVAFFVGLFAAMIPYLFFDAPYSFWMLACLLWFCSPFVFAIGYVVFQAMRGT